MGDDDHFELSPPDAKRLAGMVRKYGRRAVIAAAEKITFHLEGRRPDEALWEDVEWIETRARELRDDGRKHGALHLATHERFVMVTPHDQQNDETKLKKYKRAIQRAREKYAAKRRVLNAERQKLARQSRDD
jgi:hypothetical protein